MSFAGDSQQQQVQQQQAQAPAVQMQQQDNQQQPPVPAQQQPLMQQNSNGMQNGQSAINDMTNAMQNGMANLSMSNGMQNNGAQNGAPNGMPNGMTNGMPNGMQNGIPSDQPEESKEDKDPRTIFLRNISFQANVDNLKQVPQFQNSTHINIPVDKETARSKGYGFIEFATAKDCTDAINACTMGVELLGRHLVIQQSDRAQHAKNNHNQGGNNFGQ